MQNSGEGNIINPLASLTDPEVYNIPVLLLIGWRGRPGVHDEPQHVKQGKVTTGLLNVMGINYEVLAKEDDKAEKQIAKAIKALQNKEVFALVSSQSVRAKKTRFLATFMDLYVHLTI